ncbi:helix-turn-helix domain-containing protein [Azospirillum argentinense]
MSDRSIKDNICGGQPFAIVPADVLEDKSLSRNARWLFAILCRHADPDGYCHRSMTKLAAQEGCHKRALQKWMTELETAGLVMKLTDRGKVGAFRVVRDPANREAAQRHNDSVVAARQAEFGDYGRKGAAERAQRRPTGEQPFRGGKEEAGRVQTGTREPPFTLPVNGCSPTREPSFTSPANHSSPPREQAFVQPVNRGSHITRPVTRPEEQDPPPAPARVRAAEVREAKRRERERKRADRIYWSAF